MILDLRAPLALLLLAPLPLAGSGTPAGLTLPTFGSGAHAAFSNDSPAHYQGSLTLDLESLSCDYEGQFWFFEGDVDHAHIHSAPAGQEGPILFHLNHPVAGSFSGSFSGVDAPKLQALVQDYWYVNVHSSFYPGGEARAQIHMPRYLTIPRLSGGQVEPVSGSAATGRASLVYHAAVRSLSYELEAFGLEGVPYSAFAYLEKGGRDVVIFELEQTSAATWAGETGTLDPEDVVRILRGESYVQISSHLYPGGELRGPIQVGPLNPDATYFGASNGGIQRLFVDGGSALAGNAYLVVGSMSGTQPGLDLRGGLHLPLVPDPWLRHTLVAPNQPPYEASFGVLDASGRATTAVNLPVGTSLAGLTLHHAALIFEKSGAGLARVSAPVPFSIL